jgi:hypothetical protein
MTALELATQFHDTYERLAPAFGYKTHFNTRVFEPVSRNGKLMIAVCKEILEKLDKEQKDPLAWEYWRDRARKAEDELLTRS